MTIEEIGKAVIGLTIDEARKLTHDNGYTSRVVCEDGKHCMITCDLRFDRLNFTIVNGLVTEASVG